MPLSDNRCVISCVISHKRLVVWVRCWLQGSRSDFKIVPTFELEKQGQGVNTKESDFTWTTQGRMYRNEIVCNSLYDTCIKGQCHQCCFLC